MQWQTQACHQLMVLILASANFVIILAYSRVWPSTANVWITIHDTLEENGIDTILTNPYKTKIIAEGKIKSDKLHTKILADLSRNSSKHKRIIWKHRDWKNNKTRLSVVKVDISSVCNDSSKIRQASWNSYERLIRRKGSAKAIVATARKFLL